MVPLMRCRISSGLVWDPEVLYFHLSTGQSASEGALLTFRGFRLLVEHARELSTTTSSISSRALVSLR